jgi:hypothetical protein
MLVIVTRHSGATAAMAKAGPNQATGRVQCRSFPIRRMSSSRAITQLTVSSTKAGPAA